MEFASPPPLPEDDGHAEEREQAVLKRLEELITNKKNITDEEYEQLHAEDKERTRDVREHLKRDFRKRKKLWHNKIKKRGEAKAGVM